MILEWIRGYRYVRDLIDREWDQAINVAMYEKNGARFAIKRTSELRKWPTLKHEVQILQLFQRRHIVEFVELFDEIIDNVPCRFLVLALAGETDLAKLAASKPNPPTPVLANLLLQLAIALKTVHEAETDEAGRLFAFHGDVKPDNAVLNQNGWLTLIDFGIAQSAFHRIDVGKGTIAATPAYMTPELFWYEPYYAASNDIFNLGSTAATLISGKPPGSKDTRDFFERVRDLKSGLYREWSEIAQAYAHPDIGPLVKALMARHPRDRASIEEAICFLAPLAGTRADVAAWAFGT